MKFLEQRSINKYRNLEAAATMHSPSSCNHQAAAAAVAEDEKAVLGIRRGNGNPLSVPAEIHNSSLSHSWNANRHWRTLLVHDRPRRFPGGWRAPGAMNSGLGSERKEKSSKSRVRERREVRVFVVTGNREEEDMVALVAAAARRWRETDGDGENLIAQLRGFEKSILFIIKYAFERIAFYFISDAAADWAFGGFPETIEIDSRWREGFLLSTFYLVVIQICFDSLVLLKPKCFNLITKNSDNVIIATSLLVFFFFMIT